MSNPCIYPCVTGNSNLQSVAVVNSGAKFAKVPNNSNISVAKIDAFGNRLDETMLSADNQFTTAIGGTVDMPTTMTTIASLYGLDSNDMINIIYIAVPDTNSGSTTIRLGAATGMDTVAEAGVGKHMPFGIVKASSISASGTSGDGLFLAALK
jgi:hypothetical protein